MCLCEWATGNYFKITLQLPLKFSIYPNNAHAQGQIVLQTVHWTAWTVFWKYSFLLLIMNTKFQYYLLEIKVGVCAIIFCTDNLTDSLNNNQVTSTHPLPTLCGGVQTLKKNQQSKTTWLNSIKKEEKLWMVSI